MLQTQFHTPEENLACDEAMLEFAEAAHHPGFLRFFESRAYFVVLGYGKKLEDEVYEEICARRGIPILRRCSGGGTVVQGPGCFNFSVVLPIDSSPDFETITSANRFIMNKHREGLSKLLGLPVEIEGVSDLTISGVKFSGNAQRRKKRCLLFHGSFLLNFDLTLISELLRIPAQQPKYRANRQHEEFVRNIGLDSRAVAEVLRADWNALGRADVMVEEEIARSTRELARTKYSSDDWNRRF